MDSSRATSFTSILSAVQVMKEKHIILSCLLIQILVDWYILFGNTAESLKNCSHSQGNPRNKIRDPKRLYFDTIYWSIKQCGKLFDELVLCLLPPFGFYPLEFPNWEKFEKNISAATGVSKAKHFVYRVAQKKSPILFFIPKFCFTVLFHTFQVV